MLNARTQGFRALGISDLTVLNLRDRRLWMLLLLPRLLLLVLFLRPFILRPTSAVIAGFCPYIGQLALAFVRLRAFFARSLQHALPNVSLMQAVTSGNCISLYHSQN